jgi:hypothetical protein
MSAEPIRVSFEFFPPADAAMEATLWQSVQRLAPLAPRFVSVTYGADGSTRDRTHALVRRIQTETLLTGAPHLTCVGATRGEVLEVARRDGALVRRGRDQGPEGHDTQRPRDGEKCLARDIGRRRPVGDVLARAVQGVHECVPGVVSVRCDHAGLDVIERLGCKGAVEGVSPNRRQGTPLGPGAEDDERAGGSASGLARGRRGIDIRDGREEVIPGADGCFEHAGEI